MNHVLAIGIDDYQKCTKLNNAVRDIDNIIDVLITNYEFDRKNVITLINQNATLENIINELENLVSQQEAGDNLLILFSGHGDYDENLEVGYLIPHEAKPYSKSTYLSYSVLFNYIKALRSHHILLISDSCYSGSIFNPVRSVETSKEKLDKIPSKWAITSGRIEPVSDGKPGENSPFAESLIRNLKSNTEKLISISELSNKIVSEVADKGIQIPRGEPLQAYGHKGGEFIFRKKENKKSSIVKVDTTKTTIRKEMIELIQANYELEEKIEAAENENKTGTIKRLQLEKNSLNNILKKELIKELEIKKNDLLKNNPKMLPEGYTELHQELIIVREKKNDVVKKQKYTEAAQLRDEEKEIEKKLTEMVQMHSLFLDLPFTKDSIFEDYFMIQLMFDYSSIKNSFEKRSAIENIIAQILFLDLSFNNGLISPYIYNDEREKLIKNIPKALD